MSLASPLIDLALAIQQIPAPTFAEGRRAEFVRQRFTAEGLTNVMVDNIGNVYGCLPGAGRSAPLVISAHLDTVFPADTNLQARRTLEAIAAPGIGDNALGVAGLFGLLWRLRERANLPLPGDVWMVANVCEEGLGDLRGMKAVVDRFGSAVIGYIVLEGMAFGRVYHRGLGVKRYRITVRTSGGHSWSDFGRPSAIHVLAGLVARLADLPLPAAPRASLNVGVISGGASVNTIAAQASCELDLRSESLEALAALSAQAEALCLAAGRPDVQVEVDVIGQRPVGELSPDHPLIKLCWCCLEAQGVAPTLHVGSTDANIPLSLGLPAVCLGLTYGRNAHTVDETIELPPLAKGLEQLVSVIEGAFRLYPA